QFCDDGYLPEALVNYLMRLGWSHGDQEIFSRDEIINYFDLTHINNSPAAFNFEKLDWLNQHYLKTKNPAELVSAFSAQLTALNITVIDPLKLIPVIDAQKERVKTLKEMAVNSRYFFEGDLVFDELAAKKHLTPEALVLLKAAHDYFSTMTEWTKESLHQAIIAISTEQGVKMGQLAQPLRVAVTGGTVSPSIDLTMQLIGKENMLMRLDQAITMIAK
ncbi:MAG: glutamate--tRNA ligase family protein, partial [Gammaproteobacteria bacterium]|nr:glutamate--tRNA ligase family protein [Gammaproteobacteria bacterium]